MPAKKTTKKTTARKATRSKRPEKRKKPHAETLACVLTGAELKDRGQELGQAHGKLDELDAQLAQAKSSNKAAKDPVESKIRELAQELRSGKTYRDVEVQEVHNYEEKKAFYIRLDTGDVVRERPLTEKELQADLFPPAKT